ncbi:zinc-binding dehydrogenase [Spirosoma jeollabukense]
MVGLVSTDQKAALIKDTFGFDEAINYRTTADLPAALAAVCPNGIDIYFDNVGGPISDAVLANLNPYGRVAVCGTIANYNDTEPALSPSILPLVVYKFLTIRGFLIADFAGRFSEGLAQLAAWLNQGKLTYAETIVEGFERLPEAFIGARKFAGPPLRKPCFRLPLFLFFSTGSLSKLPKQTLRANT